MFEKWTTRLIASSIGYVCCREGWILDFPALIDSFVSSIGLGDLFRLYIFWPMRDMLDCLNGVARFVFLCMVVYCLICIAINAVKGCFVREDA